MNDWKYEINDGLVAFYEDGIERNIDKVFDALNAAESRIVELSQAVGLMTTLKPTMVMDTDHPLDMAKEVAEYVNTRIAELEAEIYQLTAHSDIERQDDKWIPEVQE